MQTRQQLTQKRLEAAKAIQEIRSRYEGKGVNLPPDVSDQLDTAIADFADAGAQLNRLEMIERAERSLTVPEERTMVSPGFGARPEDASHVRDFRAYLRGDLGRGRHLRAAHEVGLTNAGGYFVPTEVLNELVKPDDNPMFIRRISRVESVRAMITIPTITARPTASWAGETGAVSETGATIGKRSYDPNRLTAKTSVSRLLVEMSAIDVEGFLSGELDYQFRLAEEKAYMTGDGSGKPLGVFVADSSGISTARDRSTAAASIAADDVMDTFFDLRGNYRSRASWIGSRAFVKAVAKLKDGQGQYVWSAVEGPGQALVNGPVGTLMGRPLYESEDAPSTLAAGTYAAILGDFSHYRIFDFLGLAIQVLDQDPYASNGEYGYVGHKFVDGNVDLAEAFMRLKMKV